MKTSELIKNLQTSLEVNGDVQVRIPTDLENSVDEKGDSVPLVGTAALVNEDESADYLLLCDRNTMDAFL